MTRRAWAFAYASAVTVWLSGATGPVGAQNADSPPVFRADVHSVSLAVLVRQNGRPVPALGLGDFEVVDAGHPQTLSDLVYEETPLDVLFVVDLSGSISAELLASLTTSVDTVRERLRASDRAGLITFNHRIREVQPLISVRTSFRDLFGPPDGSTSLADAVTMALLSPTTSERRRLIVIFSDGLDTSSFTEGRTLVEIAKGRDAAVFTVALTTGGASRALIGRNSLFGMLAAATGGEATVVNRHEDVGRSFLKAVDDFRASYVLRYTYAGPTLPGWHPLSVKVRLPSRVDVRAREGYRVDR